MSSEDVAAIAFHMNYFNNPMGAEMFGFYEIFEQEKKQALWKAISSHTGTDIYSTTIMIVIKKDPP